MNRHRKLRPNRIFFGPGTAFGTGRLLLPALLVLAGCQTGAPPNQTSVLNTAPAALHAVSSEELKSIMVELKGTTFDRMPQELDPKNRTRARLREMAAVARSMAGSAARIQGVVNNLDLAAEDKHIFLTLVRRLETESTQLSAEAERFDLARANESLDRLSSVCIACHTLFRDPSTPLPNLR